MITNDAFFSSSYFCISKSNGPFKIMTTNKLIKNKLVLLVVVKPLTFLLISIIIIIIIIILKFN